MMDSVAMAEELAWLVKDNLSCKHLVISAEEAFIAFLDPHEASSIGNVLTLEPMSSYHRMLLHRLADIFRLAHQSVGEGEGRRLVLERCEDSCVPGLLVSDLLHCNAVSDASPNAQLILKRNKYWSDSHKYTGPQGVQLSFEERQAAYLAARERIFSDDLGDSMSQPQGVAISRPRSVPVVAQRMIAHALGKRIVAEQNCKRDNDHNGHFRTSGLDLSCASPPNSKDIMEPSVIEPTGSTINASDGNAPEEPSKSVDYRHIHAAKRMFAQALGLGSSKPISTPGKAVEKTLDAVCLHVCEAQMCLDKCSVNKPKCRCSSSDTEHSDPAQLEQGTATQRMLGQGLGFQKLSIVSERPKDI